MTKIRIALITAGIVVMLTFGILFLLVQNLDSLVKQAIESSASAATGTRVRVAKVDISVREGRGTIQGLTVANPPGFSERPLLQLDAIEIRLDPATVTTAVPTITEIRVGTSNLHYEINQFGESNLRIVQKNAKRQAQSAAGPPRDPVQSSSPEKLFRIRRLIVAEGTATLDLGPAGSGQGAARIPGLTLTDVGGESGVTARELATEIVQALGKNLASVAGNGALNRLGDSLNEAYRKLRER